MTCKPGHGYEYGLHVEVLGRICEIVSGETLEQFVTRRILKPLGMRDTHFVLPASKRHRLALLYDAQKRRRPAGKAVYRLVKYRHAESAPGILSPGGGIT